MQRIQFAFFLITSFTTLCCAAVPVRPQPTPTAEQVQPLPYTPQQIASLLNWIPVGDSTLLCDGHYYEPNIIRKNPNPPPVKTTPTNIRSDGTTIYLSNGRSIVQKNVVIQQPGRTLKGDQAHIFRNGKTGKISRIELVGHVRVREPGDLIVGTRAVMDVPNHAVKVYHAVYHHHQLWIHHTGLNAWGTAKYAVHESKTVTQLWHGSYSTCSPLNPVWHIGSSHLTIDKGKETGTARNAVIWFKHIPIFYFPYYTFPLTHKRKSGFLAPFFMMNSDSGTSVSLPYYLNIAPNVDATITPRFMGERGVMLSGLTRFLTPHNKGSAFVSYIPQDRGFKKFRRNELAKYTNNTSSILTPYINTLRDSNNNRGFFGVKNTTDFSPNANVHIDLNYVTDPYFFKDFGTRYATVNQNQLKNQIDINYNTAHWNTTALYQSYQTQHRIDNLSSSNVSQYTRLPEVDINGSYPNLSHNLDFELDAQAVNFIYRSPYTPFTFTQPQGKRLHIRPSISHPFNWSSGFVTPQLSVDNTSYATSIPNSTTTNLNNHYFGASRNIPILSLDNGLYLDHAFQINQHNFIQTLQPRVMYLYVPYVNQTKYPVFDTQLLPFSYQQVFSTNRFSGFDRLSNANQLNLGLTSQILKASDASNILTAGLGVIDYLKQPKVMLPGMSSVRRHWSPLAGQLTYYPFSNWSLTANGAWDGTVKQMNNYAYTLRYSPDGHHIISGGYEFVHGPVNQPFDQYGLSTNTSILTAGLSWPLIRHWSTLAYWHYDLSKKRPLSAFGGLEYNTCCWALRLMVERSFIGQQPINNNTTRFLNRFQTTYFVQFMLKGLGSAGNQDATNLINHSLSGYQDPFSASHL